MGKDSNNFVLTKRYEAPHHSTHGEVWYRCLSGLHFGSTQVGWAVGSTQLLRTDDGGKTWTNQFWASKACACLNPHRVFSVNESAAWVIAISSSSDIRCCYTRDRGKTWRPKSFGPRTFPNDIFFVDQNHGWLLTANGPLAAPKGRIHITRDGGQNWKAQLLRIRGTPYSVRFLDTSKGWLIEHYLSATGDRTFTALHRTLDGGNNWEFIARFKRQILDLCVLKDATLLLAGENGFIARSLDNGITWTRAKTKTRAGVNRLRFWTKNKGIAMCDFGKLLLSEDGGVKWETMHENRNDTGNFLDGYLKSSGEGIVASSTAIYSLRMTEPGA